MQRRKRIFSIWVDGNLRLLHIGLCAVATELLRNSRTQLVPSLFFLPFFYYVFFLFSPSLSLSLPLPPSLPPSLPLFHTVLLIPFLLRENECVRDSRSLSFSLSFSLFLSASVYMMRPRRVYLTPREPPTRNRSRAQATSRTLLGLFLFLFSVRITCRLHSLTSRSFASLSFRGFVSVIANRGLAHTSHIVINTYHENRIE